MNNQFVKKLSLFSLECKKVPEMNLVKAAAFVQRLFPHFDDPRRRPAMVRAGLSGLRAELDASSADPRQWTFSVPQEDVLGLATELALFVGCMRPLGKKVKSSICAFPKYD